MRVGSCDSVPSIAIALLCVSSLTTAPLSSSLCRRWKQVATTVTWGCEHLHALSWKVQEKSKALCALQQPHLLTSSSPERTDPALLNFPPSYASFSCLVSVVARATHVLQRQPQPAVTRGHLLPLTYSCLFGLSVWKALLQKLWGMLST